MMRKVQISILLILLFACSQVSDKNKINNEINKLALSWYQLAERNRINNELDKALRHYELANEFALKRNNLKLQLFILSRQALILSQQGKTSQSLERLNSAKQLLKYELPGAHEEFNILQITVLKHLGEHAQALKLLNLNTTYFKTEEQNVYARWLQQELEAEIGTHVSNNYFSSLAATDFEYLYKQYEDNKLVNSEILTYVGVQYLNLLAVNQETEQKILAVLNAMLRFFSEQENAAKTAQCYKIVANYFSSIDQEEKASYFLDKAKRIDNYLE